jgi:hypothetical protein
MHPSVSTARRKLNWQKKTTMNTGGSTARQHAHLVIATDDLTPEQVLQKVLDYLKEMNP